MRTQVKYELIKEDIYNNIKKGIYISEQKIPSENKLCELYNTSRITVRKAIDELVLTDVLYRVQGVGTFVSSKKEQKPLKKVLIIASHNDIFLGSQMMFQMLSGVESVLYKKNITLSFMQEPRDRTEKGQSDFLRKIESESPDGIVYFSCSDMELVTRISSLRIPIVFTDTEPSDPLGDVVIGEDYKSAYDVVELMLDEGLQRIGFFCLWDRTLTTAEKREKGIISALREHNIEYQDKWMFQKKSPQSVELFMQDQDVINHAVQYLKENAELEAVVAMNDNNAWALQIAAQRMNITISKDLKLVSYGNYSMSNYIDGGISSFEQNFGKYGKEAAKLIIKRMNGSLPGIQQRVNISYKLLRRKSF